MKKGIRFHDIRKESIEEKVKWCKQSGFDYVQLVLEKAESNYALPPFTTENALEIKNRLNGVDVAVLGSYINPSTSDDTLLQAGVEKFCEKIRFASVLKPIVVGTETGFYGDAPSCLDDTPVAYRRLLQTMELLATKAEEYGVCIGVEGVHCFVINTPKKMKRLVDDLASKFVKVIFDPVNYLTEKNYLAQDEMIKDAFELFSDKIAVLHAKDFAIENGVMKRLRIGEGLLNYPLIFDYMQKNKVSAPIIVEEYTEDEAQNGAKYLEKLFVTE